MATTLQDVSSKLMKPAKDLAEWNFPLAQILEDYYTLLEQPCDLNFGEAALVLQNSANVYARRVEYLFQETSALNQSMNEHEEEEENTSTEKNQRKHTAKSKIDFNNFEIINFTKEINRNCNLKPMKEDKKMKLLNKRYPQLENISRNKFSLEIADVNGEIIGKKYDFRCNQPLSTFKMLVDEISPDDFTRKEVNINMPEILETDLEVVNAFDSCSDYGDTFRDTCVFSPAQDSAYGSMISNSDANTPSSRDLSDFSHTLNDSMRDPKDSFTSAIESTIECDKKLIGELEQPQTAINHSENFQSIDNSVEKTAEVNCIIDKTSRIRDSIETDAGYTSGDPDDIQQQISSPPRKIRRITRSSIVNELNEKIWKPIPFDEGVPDKLPKTRAEFKLPCHISLLKYRTKSRKKKSSPDNSLKREKLKNYLLNECDEINKNNNINECDGKKLLLYSPSKPLSFRMKEEIEELQKIIEQCYKSKSQIDGCNYRAIENSNMDLLGFESELEGNNSNIAKNSESSGEFVDEQLRVIESTCENKSCLFLPPLPLPEPSCSHTPRHSPEHSTNFDADYNSDDFDDEPTNVEQNQQIQQKRIEQKMMELRREFDARNEREEETKKWYKTIEALKSVDRRATFHVHQYEKQILNALKVESSHQLNFDVIAMQQEPDDIARLFVASLHLANTYNVQINVVNSNENSNVNLTLLNGDTKHLT